MTWGFVTCGPNEALVVSGCCYSKPLLVPGGRAFVWPSIQRVQRISLNTMTLQVESPTVYTSQGVPISVTGIAQVKIQGQNAEMLLSACEQFLGKSDQEIQHIALVTLEGHQRAIMGSMTVEEIYKDRKMFSKKVFEVASSDLINMGITVVSYTLKDIRDEEALGMARTAEVKRDARIGEAEAQAEAKIKEAMAEEQRMAARFLNDTEIAKAQRDFELKKAALKQKWPTNYKLLKQSNVSKKSKCRLPSLNARRRSLSRSGKYRGAKRSSTLQCAEAHKLKTVLEAEAAAEAVKVRGEAEAFAIKAKAVADAEQMAKKAEAWKEYGSAAMVAAEVAAPLSQARKVTMVSCGGGEVGAAKLTGEVLSIVQAMVEPPTLPTPTPSQRGDSARKAR
ncbi:hypothetical protein MSG28_000910 [Choristoneura fumiferana]|uniref:Uncharacterized protein n=1 Tax=Choristoneura fumiferana TaxID=7141 RepID=A0ACC0K396_CHOFU|nr:hypothetical protein MSG28_000910 [Choristoneura fumiferana]